MRDNNRKINGMLYVVSTPIGNSDDITIRAINILNKVDVVICEEVRNGQRLLKKLNINKPLITLNEHNEKEQAEIILIEIMSGKNFALISDCGTPIFQDPGRYLLSILFEMNVKVSPIPGASSLVSAISVCPVKLDKFTFLGFLPPKSDQRAQILAKNKQHRYPLILMDTPYRLSKLLQEIMEIFGKKQKIFFAADLTLQSEVILHESVEKIFHKLRDQKREFIVIVE